MMRINRANKLWLRPKKIIKKVNDNNKDKKTSK